MALKHEYSVMAGAATAVVVYGVYQSALPSAADARSMVPNEDLAKAERTASWVSAGVVAGISLIAQDPTIFIIGGTMAIGMAWMHRHANAVQPTIGRASMQGAVPRVTQSEAPASYATPRTAGYGTTF